MTPQFNVHLLPELVPVDELAGSAVVVIDVLRATTTMAYALAAGARSIVPCLEVDEARRRRAEANGGDPVLLGGERGGLRIDGFDLGNSPAEYTPERVADHTIYFTTTNGTRALQRCTSAEKVLLGAFVNVSAVAIDLAAAPRVDLVCAGTRGQITRDDTLLAGLLIEKLQRRSPTPCQLNDQAALALDAWRGLGPPVSDLAVTGRPHAMDKIAPLERLAEILAETQGGRDLAAVGLANDLLLAAAVDRFDLVPRFDPQGGRIQ